MEVNTELFTIMTQAGANYIITIPDAEMVRLNVINNGVKSTKWSIESIPAGIYLKGERETFRGINKFMIFCSRNHTIELHVIFDPEGRGEEIVQFLTATSIFIDDKTIPINQYMTHKAELVNGWINIQYAIDGALLRRIANAHTVGVAVQMVYEAPTFMGFEGMDFSDGAKKLPGLLGVCRGK
jgi:hypothetical protein